MLNPGIKIYEYRIQKGVTQSELALKAGMAQANLSNIEKGKKDFTVSTLIRLALALEIKPSQLIEDEIGSVSNFVLSRTQIETLAQAVINPSLKVSSEIQKLAGWFRLILPSQKGGRTEAVQKIQKAWTFLRKRFSSQQIRGVVARVEDARQRTYAKKTH